MAPALTVIPDRTLRRLVHLLSDHADLGPDLDHLIEYLEERNGAEMRISQKKEAVEIHDDLVCVMKMISAVIGSDREVHTRI
jgi:hypothetical protein